MVVVSPTRLRASSALLRSREPAFASSVPLDGLAREAITRRFDFGRL
ncbi:MAG TPA: hypothetical protein VIG76_13440 [Amnibacterium sp.]